MPLLTNTSVYSYKLKKLLSNLLKNLTINLLIAGGMKGIRKSSKRVTEISKRDVCDYSKRYERDRNSSKRGREI